MTVVEQTCTRCGVTKPAAGNFKRSGQAKSGYVGICHACRAADHAAVAHLTCEGCRNTMRAAENFGRNPATKTGYHYKCRTCLDAEREQRVFAAQRLRVVEG